MPKEQQLWPYLCFNLENVPCTLGEGCVFCCICIFGLIGLLCCLSPLFSDLPSVWLFSPLLWVEYWSLPTIPVEPSISSFSSVSFCSLYFGAVLLDVCVFIIFLSSFLSVSVHLYPLSFLGEKRKGKKDQHIAETYSKHIAERKESIQYNQEHTLLIESPKVKGAQFSLVQEWEEGIRERTEDQAVLPSL